MENAAPEQVMLRYIAVPLVNVKRNEFPLLDVLFPVEMVLPTKHVGKKVSQVNPVQLILAEDASYVTRFVVVGVAAGELVLVRVAVAAAVVVNSNELVDVEVEVEKDVDVDVRVDVRVRVVVIGSSVKV